MLSYTVLFLLVILAHERRRIVPVTATEHPTAAWAAQQVVDALPWDSAPPYLLRDRESVYQQHAQFVHDYQFWGHWAHKRADTHGRIYYLSPEVMLGNARGRAVEPARLRRVFRLRQLIRQVRPQGHIRLHNFGLYVDHGLSGQTVEVLIDDEAMRIEQAEHLLVSYPCVYDTRQRRITAVDGTGRQHYRPVQVIQLM